MCEEWDVPCGNGSPGIQDDSATDVNQEVTSQWSQLLCARWEPREPGVVLRTWDENS